MSPDAFLLTNTWQPRPSLQSPNFRVHKASPQWTSDGEGVGEGAQGTLFLFPRGIGFGRVRPSGKHLQFFISYLGRWAEIVGYPKSCYREKEGRKAAGG